MALTFRFHTDEDHVPLDSSHQALVGEDLRTVRYFDGATAPDSIVSEDGEHLASQSTPSVRLDDLAHGTRVNVTVPGTAAPEGRFVRLLGWSADSTGVYAKADDSPTVWRVGVDGSLRRWSVPVGPDTATVTESPGGRRAVIKDNEVGAKVVDLTTGKDLVSLTRRGGEAGHVAVWTPDGRRVVRLTREETLDIVDVSSGLGRATPTGDKDQPCLPLVMLTNTRLLCEGTASTQDDDERRYGLSTLDLDTGQRTVVAQEPENPMSAAGYMFLDVADDLARRWTFTRSQRWVYRPADV